MNSTTINPRQSLLVFENEEEAIAFSAHQFVEKARQAITLRNSFSVALSGGSTPKKFFEFLSHFEEALELPWEKIALFWSDERAVASDHPDSNFGMAMQFLAKEPFNKANVFRMEADRSDKEAAATDYETLIRKHCVDGRFDIVYLGIGEDGHTASLFPGSTGLSITNKKVICNYIEEKKSWRMTLTFSCINEARNIVILAFGPSKAAILDTIFSSRPTMDLPVTLVGTTELQALFICDKAAVSAVQH